MVFEKIKQETSEHSQGFEQLVYCHDASVGLKAIISVHSTRLGPAVGGCRMWNYANEGEALHDVIRLSKGMTYKAAISGLNWGGGKAVLIGDAKKDKTPQMLERFGEYVDRLGGTYVTAKDVGIGSEDLKTIQRKTKHVLGIEGVATSSGDPSPMTAYGVYHGIKSAARAGLGSDSLKGVRIAVQGLGSVSYYLLEHLHKEGATIVGCDIDAVVIERAVKKYGIETVHPDKIYDVKCDIFSPNALGSTINSKTIPRLQAKIIAGGANNQLATEADGEEVFRRGLVYVPDYAINAGGLINIYHEGREGSGTGAYDHEKALEHTAQIGTTVTRILERSKLDRMPSHQVADRMAEERYLG